MNYGFIIDNRKCIGCHACSTACKAENEVPLGVHRTWVKYVETGAYPDVRRHFQVTRCNHCANPPCVRICPVTAMYQRADGIVEFDSALCIGCKACLQACPYDAIYIDPDSHTAAKCHYCAHRTDIGLEPACVVVCPEHAIIAGDIDDPTSEISHLLATTNVTVRKPEQGTAPKLFYIEGNEIALHPTATPRTPETFLWSDVIPLHPRSAAVPSSDNQHSDRARGAAPTADGAYATPGSAPAPIRTPQPQVTGDGWPIHIGSGRMADQMVQVSYNAQHRIPWHWPVPTYLVTKAIGSGLLLLFAVGLLFDFVEATPAAATAIGLVGLLFIGATTALLVYDLERPERFITILTRPQWRSWLTRGAYLLLAFSLAAGLWWLLELAVWGTLLGPQRLVWLRTALLWLLLPLAVGAATYTAFLFGQAEGRDMWQSPLLPLHMFVQALIAGSGVLLLLSSLVAGAPGLAEFARPLFIGLLILDLFIILTGEFGMPHATETAAQAAHAIHHGHYRRYFWWGALLVGHALPLLLSLPAQPPFDWLAALSAVAGLYFYEYAFIMAPQEVPNS
jgi:Fe-S-cluster-containing dehydrogenase component/formate-dependent nitrite reductase membrane component NrfD